MRSDELEYDLPQELIAQHPADRRDASRLLVYDRATGEIRHRTLRRAAGRARRRARGRERHARRARADQGRRASGGDGRGAAAGAGRRRRMGGARAAVAAAPRRASGSARPSSSSRSARGAGACGSTVRRRGRCRCRRTSTSGSTIPSATRRSTRARRAPRPRRPRGCTSRPSCSAGSTSSASRSTSAWTRSGRCPPTRSRSTRCTASATRSSRRRGSGSARRERVLAVGTTTTRVLESLARGAPLAGRTDLFITPGFEFRRVDALLTNFHLPRSTLLALVMAFAGVEETRELYRARDRRALPLLLVRRRDACPVKVRLRETTFKGSKPAGQTRLRAHVRRRRRRQSRALPLNSPAAP